MTLCSSRRGDSGSIFDVRGPRGRIFRRAMPSVSEATQEGHKTLVVSQFTGMLAILRQRLDREGVARTAKYQARFRRRYYWGRRGTDSQSRQGGPGIAAVVNTMAKLGSEKRPVIVRVKTGERAHTIMAACTMRGWQCIAGVEPDEPEDISDFERLMNPVGPARSEKIGRNEPCSCGSGKKYKRCCADKGPANFPAGRFRYEPGSYGGPGAAYMPSILCYERSGPDSWREHFCLVNPDESMQDDPEAASAIAQRHLEAAFAHGGEGSVEDFATSLQTSGYVRVSDFRMASAEADEV